MNDFVNDTYIVLSLFLLTLIGLLKYQSKPGLVFGVLLLVLFVSGIVDAQQVLGNFSNIGVIALVLLMICSLALEKAKFIRVLTKYLISPNYKGTWLKLFVFTTLSSALLNNSAVVATLMGSIRNNIHHSPSKLLIPLSYSAILGGTLTLVGTSTNLIVNSMVIEAGYQPLSFFEFTKIGVALVLCCGAVLFIVSRWLPQYEILTKTVSDYFIDAEVMHDSPLVGNSVESNGLRNLESLFLVEIVRDGQLISPVSPKEIIHQGDRLLFSGDIKKVTLLQDFEGLMLFDKHDGLSLENLSEVIIRPESMLKGMTIKQSGFRALFDAAVVAVKRDGKPLSGKLGEVGLQAGDNLVLAVGKDFKSRHNLNKNFYLISGVDTEPTLTKNKEWLAIFGFSVAILSAALGLAQLFTALVILLSILILTKTLSVNEILPRLPVQIWLIIASALTLSDALINVNANIWLEQMITQNAAIITPFIGLLIIYFSTWLLTELVTNNAAAALMFPLAIGLAESLDLQPMAYILAVAFASSASFISPYGYQTNLMVFNAGSYRLFDFVKIGLPVLVVYSTVAIIGIKSIYL